VKLSFSNRRRIVRAFWRAHDRYDGALTVMFEDWLHFKPRKHTWYWAICAFNFNPCVTCFGWRMMGIGFVAGVAAAALAFAIF
jgi:hypothetical protein